MAEVKSEILNETKADVQRATEEATLGLKDVMRSDFKAELRAEIMEETKGDISSEIEKALAGSSIMGGMFRGVTVGGFVDTMFSYNFRQHGEDSLENAGDIAGLNFIGENDDNTFTIESLAIFFDKEVTDEDPIGWQAHTYWGEKAKRITFLGEGAGRVSSITAGADGVFGTSDDGTQQSGTDDTARNDIFTLAVANISWNAPLFGKHVKLTMGKMYTWIGYELVENIGNPNYSHGINYNNSIPFTHMGLNADVSEFLPSDKLGLTLYYVNGWDSFIDNNESKSYGAYLTYTPNDDFFISFATIYGNEGWNKRTGGSTTNSFVSDNNGGATFMYDIVINYALPQVDKLSLGANWDWGQIEDFVAHDVNGNTVIDIDEGLSTAQWWSVGLYAKYDYTDAQQGALRYEYFDDTDGARAFGYSIWDITYTQNMKVRENLMLRPEIRYIKHNAPDVHEPSVGDRGNTADSEFIFTFGTEYVF